MSCNKTSTNTSVWEPVAPAAMQFALGVVGNIIALVFLICSAKTHKWRPFYRLVCGLAVTDMLGILLVYPTVMIRYATDFTYDFPIPLCDYSSFIYTYGLLSSAFIICAMSFDRFLAIMYPFVYNVDTKERRTNITLVVIWITAGIISSLHLIGLGNSHSFYPGSWCFFNFVNDGIKNRINSFLYSIIGIIILITTFSLNTTVILKTCCNMRRRITDKRSTIDRMNHLYIIIFLCVVVVVFTICWTPLMINILEHATLRRCTDSGLELLVLRFAVNNAIIDPWIYILLRKENLKVIHGLYLRVRLRQRRDTTTSSSSRQRSDEIKLPSTEKSYCI